MAKLMSIMCCVFMLTGCGLINGESDYIPYAKALETHSSSESSRIQAQSSAIVNLATNVKTETKTEGALLAVISMMQIANLKPVKLNIIKPTTGYDVLDHHAGTMINGAVQGVLGYFTFDAFKEQTRGRGNTFNGDVQMEDSLNNSELHQTYSDGAAANLSPMAVDPVIVE